MIFFQP